MSTSPWTSDGFRIAEVAGRTGFTAATLRYYEDIGVVPPASRSEVGYRIYTSRDVERLRFVARMRELGCSLPEIAELVHAWGDHRCAPVQERLRQRVATKIEEAQAQISALVALTGELQRASVALSGPSTPGPCDDDCACVSTPPAPSPIASCTLDPTELLDRISDWQAVLAGALAREAIAGGVRIQLGPEVALPEVARLAAAERGCCGFFSFAITVDDRGLGLEVTAPENRQEVVTALFGAAA